jgi:hypothetical protein
MMNAKEVKEYFFTGRFIYDRTLALILWFGLSFLGVLQVVAGHELNNYYIFKGVYYHTLHGQNLYIHYPAEYNDINLYGPVFSLVIAPFALLPDNFGAFLWVLANAAFLLFAFSRLPLSSKWLTILLFLSCYELMGSSTNLQINPIICGCIILGFAYTHKGKEIFALLFIMAATFIKIYGIVGLAFFFFSKKPFRFIGWAVAWSVILFFAPLILTNFSFLIQSYQDWFVTIKEKNITNLSTAPGSIFQNVAVSGMIRRIFHLPGLNDLFILIPAVILFLSQYIRYKYFYDIRLRLYILCSALIATVIFSTSAESSTYIIAMAGVYIWYLLQPKTKRLNIFFFFVFVITSFSYTEVFGRWAGDHIFRPYSLKALMPFIVWLIIIIQVYIKQFLKASFPFQKNKTVLSVV